MCCDDIKQIISRYFAVVRKIYKCVWINIYQWGSQWNAKHRIVTSIISRFLRLLFARLSVSLSLSLCAVVWCVCFKIAHFFEMYWHSVYNSQIDVRIIAASRYVYMRYPTGIQHTPLTSKQSYIKYNALRSSMRQTITATLTRSLFLPFSFSLSISLFVCICVLDTRWLTTKSLNEVIQIA